MRDFDWRPLGEICKFIDYRGKTPKKTKKGIPLITAKIIKNGFIEKFEEFIAEEDYESWMRRGIPEYGAVVFTTEAPLGEVAQIKSSEKVALAQRVITMMGIDQLLDNNYLKYALQFPPVKSDIQGRASGTTVQGIKSSELKKVKIPLPEYEVQVKIGEILGSLDDKIELNRRMNETLEQMAMALYKHWFVDFGPFQDGEFMESEIGPIPINWELRSLYSLANYINGMAFKQRDLNDQKEGLPVIKISELNADSPKSAKYYAGPYQDKYFLNTGDVLFSWSATLDIYLWSHGPALLNQHIFNVKSNGSFSKSTLYFILKSVINEFKEIAASRATTMGHIKKEHLEEKLIPYPPAEVRVKIESQFANYFDLMLSNLLEINTLAETRDYLLPRLLSGEIEVREAEEQVEEVLAHA